MKISVTHIEQKTSTTHMSLENDPNIQKLPSLVNSDLLEYYWENYAYCERCNRPTKTYDQKQVECKYEEVTTL